MTSDWRNILVFGLIHFPALFHCGLETLLTLLGEIDQPEVDLAPDNVDLATWGDVGWEREINFATAESRTNTDRYSVRYSVCR